MSKNIMWNIYGFVLASCLNIGFCKMVRIVLYNLFSVNLSCGGSIWGLAGLQRGAGEQGEVLLQEGGPQRPLLQAGPRPLHLSAQLRAGPADGQDDPLPPRLCTERLHLSRSDNKSSTKNIITSQISMIMLNILWRMSSGTGTFFNRKENNTNFILFFIPVPLFKRKGENIIQKRSLYKFESINGSSYLTFCVKLSFFHFSG